MWVILAAIAPNFLLILLGWGIRVRRWLDASFWVQTEKLTYYLLFPALLVANLAEAKLDGLPVAAIIGAQGLGLVGVLALVVLPLRLVWPRLATDGAVFTSFFQGSVRPNTYIGFAMASALWGANGVTVTALAAALVIPLVNLVCVIALIRWGEGDHQRGLGPTLWAIARNPLILACLIGAALNVSGLGLPPVIGPVLKIMAQASLALGLLCVGAGLEFSAIRGAGSVVGATLVVKLAVVPAAVAALAWWFGLSGSQLAATIAYAALPVATNSYVLARQLGGDARLAAAIITTSTIAAAATLPVAAMLIARLP